MASRQTKKRESHYENEGEAFHFYTSSHDRIFYNKLKDYERTKNTAIDKYRLQKERSLAKELTKSGIQILRFEARYNGQQTVKGKLKSYIKTSRDLIIFNSLFNEQMWKEVLMDEWRDIVGTSASQLTLKFETSPDTAFRAFLKYATSGKKKNVYALNKVNDLYGTFAAIRDMGVQNYVNLQEQIFSNKTLGVRLETKTALVNDILRNIPIHPIISEIEAKLRDYERLKPEWIEGTLC